MYIKRFNFYSLSENVKKLKVNEGDVYFTTKIYVSSRTFIQQEVCEGKHFPFENSTNVVFEIWHVHKNIGCVDN